MKRLFTLLLFVVLLFCGCGKGQRTGATLEVDLTKSYASEPIDMNGMKVRPVVSTDKGLIMEHWVRDNDVRLYLYDLTENTYTKIEKTETNAPACFVQLPDGRLAALYDILQGRKNGSNLYDGKTRMLEIYDDNLQSESVQYFGEDVPEQVLCQSQIAMDKEGYWYLFAYDENGFYSLTVLNPDLTVKGTIELDSVTGQYLAVGKSGKVYGLMKALSDDKYAAYASYQLYQFDAGTMTTERLDDFDVPAEIDNIMDGSIYELYYYDENGIYGVNEDGTSEFVVDFMNSDFPDSVWSCSALIDGTFIIEYSEDTNYTFKYYQLRPRTEEEIENIQIISLAGVALNRQLVQDVCKYNQSQLDYRIVIKDYMTDYKEIEYPYTEAVEQFKNDLLGGVIPDIICMDNMPYQQLSNKGLLTDFVPMLDEDERFDPELYHMNIFEGMKNGEKLEKIGFSFRISTAAAKTELVGEQQGRTPEEYIDMINALPEGMQLLPGTSQERILDCYLVGSQSAFIDRNTMTCNFTDESFVHLLELAGSLQTQEELYGDEEAWMWSYYTDDALLDLFDIEKPITYHDTHASTFQYEDITLVGFPDASGGNGGKYKMNYTISLTSRSDKVEPVWEFIIGELSSIRQNKKCLDSWDYGMNSLPVMQESLSYCMLASTLGANRPCGNASEAEMEVLENYVEGLRMCADDDPFITDIITEEAEMYFAGDQTAERAAEMIQSRVSLYLSEQK